MKVLITGATGLVGSELVSLLLKNGININYLTTSKRKIQNENQYKGFYWDPHNGVINENCIDEVDAIIHLAGSSIAKRWTSSYKEEVLESRIVSANILYNLLKNKQNTVKHFICASAIGIYPDSMENVYAEDETGIDASFLGNVVQKWEAAADDISRLGIKVSKIRTGLVLSSKGGMLKELAKPVRLGLGSAFGTGEQMQSWIHLQDLTGIYFFVLQNKLEGVFNAVAPYPVSQNDMVKCVASVLDRPYFMPNIPKFIANIVLGEMSILLLSSQNVSAKKIISEGYQFKYLSLEKALQQELQ